MPRWTQTVDERFWSKVDRRGPDECWPWAAFVTPDGYGHFRLNSRTVNAHRAAFQLWHGVDVPSGYEVDHVCFNRSCCNPAHLRMLTTAENRSRSRRFLENKCYRGHELTDDNVYWSNASIGMRACLTCRRARMAARGAA